MEIRERETRIYVHRLVGTYMNISELKFSVEGNGNRYLNLNEDEDLKELKRNKI